MKYLNSPRASRSCPAPAPVAICLIAGGVVWAVVIIGIISIIP